MYKIPVDILKDSKDIINSLIFMLEESEVDFPTLRKIMIRDAKRHVKLLKDNYYV